MCFAPGDASAAVRAKVGPAEKVTAQVPVAVRRDEAVMHVPVASAERARAVAVAHEVDALVSVGGGSTTGLAKAIALTSGLPIAVDAPEALRDWPGRLSVAYPLLSQVGEAPGSSACPRCCPMATRAPCRGRQNPRVGSAGAPTRAPAPPGIPGR